MPIEPPASRWQFPVDVEVDETGLMGVGADEEPGTLLAAYRSAFLCFRYVWGLGPAQRRLRLR